MIKQICLTCGGFHEPDSSDCWVEFRGYRFHPPFKCMCCGKEICARQFAFGRCCGVCDTGACQSGNRAFQPQFAHPLPSWWDYDGQKLFEAFIKSTNAKKVKEIDREDNNNG